MTDLAIAARRAREKLAQGLEALQSASVPPGLIDAADPVAEAMSALWGIESSGGARLAQAGPVALLIWWALVGALSLALIVSAARRVAAFRGERR